ncbi:hypothetical protein LLG95_04810 [bacterium]|nr:hypothetical protein [bacterium]
MKKFFLLLSVIVVAVVAAAGLWLLNAAREYRRLVDFGTTTRETYRSLAKEYNFKQPSAPNGSNAADTESAARWDEFLKVRERMIAAIPTGFDRRARQILAMPKPGLGGQVSFLLDLAPELKPAVDAHIRALREVRMSPVEYRRRLGIAMLAAIDAPDKYPAGKAYRKLMDQLVRFGRRLAENAKMGVEPAQIPDAPFALQTLRKEFGSYPMAPSEVPARLETSRETAYLIDILVVAVEPEQLADREPVDRGS